MNGRSLCGGSHLEIAEPSSSTKAHGVNNETNGIVRVSLWQRGLLFGVIAGFVLLGISRLNDCDLFNPDSPRYVLYSQSIVETGDYRAIDLPGAPLYSWRPPGLSLVLAPVMALRPYDVVAAKIVVLLTAVLLLVVVFRLTLLQSHFWPAILVTLVVGSNPSFLILSTEVLTEVPYTLCVLTVLLILSHSTFTSPENFAKLDGTQRWVRWLATGLAVGALAFTPWLRTAGVSLVIAIGLWSLFVRPRWRWLGAAGAAVVGLAMLAFRNQQASGENYVGSLISRMKSQGVFAVVQSGLETIGHYLWTIPGILLPGLTNERTWYAPVTVHAIPIAALPFAFAACAAAGMISLAMLGMCQRRAKGGSLALLYLMIYAACLVVWPWRHERFVWPVIPVLLSYLPSGVSVLSSTLGSAGPAVTFSATSMLIALSGWQLTGCESLVRSNLEFVRDRDSFHANRHPGFYFSDWRGAGQWLLENSLPSDRVLTWHAAVASTSHRFQKRVQFETLTPDKLRAQIEAFGARYLVVPAAQFGDGFSWQMLNSDTAITLKQVYSARDVAVLEILPNRAGDVSKTAYPEWLESQLALAAQACEDEPTRVDLAIRRASLLREAGRDREAINEFQKLVDRGVVTARVCGELGWLHLENQDYALAAKYLDMARLLPNAEAVGSVLFDGALHARERMNQSPKQDPSKELSRRLNRVKTLIGSEKYLAAEHELAAIPDIHQGNAEVQFVRGRLHHRIGELSSAADCYEKSIKLGHSDAIAWLRLIRLDQAVQSQSKLSVDVGEGQEEIDPLMVSTHIRLGEMLAERGWPGRALTVYESAMILFPDEPSIQQRLADLYRKFSMPERAVPLYEFVLQRKPDDEPAKMGLEIARSHLQEPVMMLHARQSERGSAGINLSSR